MNLLMPGDVRPFPNVVWNLLLAIVPVIAAFAVAGRVRRNLSANRRAFDLVTALEFVVWAGFLPNTCYLLTEWRHYIVNIATSDFYPAVRWSHDAVLRLLISTIFYVFYSGSGLVAFFMAVWPLDRLLRERSPRGTLLVKLLVFALCALGVYLGLIHRYNTWDLITPWKLVGVLNTIVTILERRFVLVLMLGFTVVLWVLYEAFDIWMDGLTLRWNRRRPGIDR